MDEVYSSTGSSVIPAARVRVSEESIPIGAPRGGDAQREPKVQLVREGGVIREIDVICSCGEVIRIRCDYG